MKLILASNNGKKLKELKEILGDMGVEVLSQSEAGLKLEVEETGTTFAENALLKAEGAAKALGLPAIADDSGLVVEALGGAPGVYSARYGGPGLDDTQRYELLLKNMEHEENRAAKFVSSIACVFPGGDVLTAEGTCGGEILRHPVGDGGFGYDPVFLPKGKDKSMAQLTPEEKNAISHRGNALRAFRVKLEDYLKRGTTHADK